MKCKYFQRKLKKNKQQLLIEIYQNLHSSKKASKNKQYNEQLYLKVYTFMTFKKLSESKEKQ